MLIKKYAQNAGGTGVIMSECEDCLQIMKERDLYSDKADELAQAIADHFCVDIGEHSNMNCPWENALEWIEPSIPVKDSATGNFRCGHCGWKKIEKLTPYCPDCGQRLDWSEE